METVRANSSLLGRRGWNRDGKGKDRSGRGLFQAKMIAQLPCHLQIAPKDRDPFSHLPLSEAEAGSPMLARRLDGIMNGA